MNAASLPDGPILFRKRRAKAGFAVRLERMRSLIGLTDADVARVRRTKDVLMRGQQALLERAHARLLAEPETAAYFARADRANARDALATRHAMIAEWLRIAIDAPIDGRLADYLAGIGRAHTKRGGIMPVTVKGRYLLAMTSILQSEIASTLAEALADPQELAAAIIAWDRLLMLHLDLFLAVYGSAEGTPHWY